MQREEIPTPTSKTACCCSSTSESIRGAVVVSPSGNASTRGTDFSRQVWAWIAVVLIGILVSLVEWQGRLYPREREARLWTMERVDGEQNDLKYVSIHCRLGPLETHKMSKKRARIDSRGPLIHKLIGKKRVLVSILPFLEAILVDQ